MTAFANGRRQGRYESSIEATVDGLLAQVAAGGDVVLACPDTATATEIFDRLAERLGVAPADVPVRRLVRRRHGMVRITGLSS